MQLLCQTGGVVSLEKNSRALDGRQPPPGSGRQVRRKVEGTDPVPMKRRHMVSNGREHPLDLMVAPFGEGEPGYERIQNFQSRRRKGPLLALQEEIPPRKDFRLRPDEGFRQCRDVSFWGM